MFVSTRTRRTTRTLCLLASALLLAAAAYATAAADTMLGTIPQGTRLRFHVTAPISSNGTKTGEAFNFVLLDPIVSDGKVIVAQGATGEGTVYLAGHAGSSGHEGDLTLRIDSAHTVDGNLITFNDQRFEVNGRNRKVAVQLLGFVPYAGLASGMIRGSDIHVGVDRTIETVLLRPATITDVTPLVPAPAAPTGTATNAAYP